jgi:hypothetical protein
VANFVYIHGMITGGKRKYDSSSMILILTTAFSVFWIGCAPHTPIVLRAMGMDCPV